MLSTVSSSANESIETAAHSAGGNKISFIAIAVLAAAGMAISAFSLQRHYAKSATSFCEVAESFNCDIVNRSEYSSLMGIPVAAIGVVGYAVLLALATLYRSQASTPLRLLLVAFGGLAFALYLTYIEGYVLSTWCILCLSSLAVISLITLLAAVVNFRQRVRR